MMRRVIAFAIMIIVAIGIMPRDVLAAHNDEPQILRAEQLGIELSQDIDNPTKLPYFHTLKLMGNDVYKNTDIPVQIYVDGYWTRVGLFAEFDENAEYSTTNGRYTEFILYNRIHAIKYVILDDGQNCNILAESPTYYVIYLDEHSGALKLVQGEDIELRLTTDQLIIETRQVYPHINGWPILLKDKATGEEQLLAFYDNPNFLMQSNRIIFSNLSIDREHIYEVTISSGTFTNGNFDKFDDFKHNLTFVVDLIVDTQKTFKDVPVNHWAYTYINELAERHIIDGYDDGTFRPEGLVSRSEFAKMMLLTLQLPLITGLNQTFADVPRSDWAFDYIENTKPYLTGYKSGEEYYFKGSTPAVREDMAVALVKAMDLQNETVDLDELKTLFSDYATISPNMQKYVLIAYKNQLISGYPDGTFGAQRAITRAEAAALLFKAYKSNAMEKITFDP